MLPEIAPPNSNRIPDGTSTLRAVLQLAALTMTRPGKIRFMRRSEIIWPNALWRIPAERIKTRWPHDAPLSAVVIAGAFAHPSHDQIEARALNAVFGCGSVPVMAPASLLGISGATGALGLSAALIGMRDGFLPSGAATPTRTGACADLDLIEGGNRSATINTVLVNAASLGGGNASILVQRYDAAS